MYGEDNYAILKENKKMLTGGAMIFLLLLIVIFGGDETETSAGEITMPIEAEQIEKPKKERPRKIIGAEKANGVEKLADPFSIAHLTRDEMAQAREAAELKQREDMQLLEHQETQQAQPSGEALSQTKKPEDNGIVLQGIVKGRNGRMAILKYGEMNVTAVVGENIGGHVLTEIRDNEVILDNGEKLQMQLQ